MLSELDPLMDFRCPHCAASLRLRRVPRQPGPDGHLVCPLCAGGLVERRHPAIANNWLWSRFYLPGVLLCALGIFLPSLAWLLPFAVVVLLLGFVALLVYVVRERWGWKRYAVPGASVDSDRH